MQCSKEQIKKYAHNQKLTWIIDDSNTKIHFDRNFLRLHVLPQLQNRWPNINKSIARSAQLCAEQERLLDELLKEDLKKLYYYDDSLLLKPLIHISIEKRQALLRRWLVSFNIQMPSYKKLLHIWKNVILAKKDAIPVMQLNEKFSLRRFQNRLYIIPTLTQKSLNGSILHWTDIKTKISLPNKLGILIPKIFSDKKIYVLNKIKSSFRHTLLSKNIFLYNNNSPHSDKTLSLSLIRAPYKEEKITIKFEYTLHDKIHIFGSSYRKKMKKIWKELKIPPWMRKNTPLLFYNNTLIAALGAFITQEGNIKNTDIGLGIYWVQKIQLKQNQHNL